MSDASRSARWSASWGAERGAADGDQPTSGAGRATGDRADGGGAAAGADGLVPAGDERAVLFPMEMSLLWEAQRCLLRAALAHKSRSGLLQQGGLEWFKAIPALIRFGHDGQTCPAFPDHLMSGWRGVLVVQVTAQDGHRSHCRSQTARRGHPAADREVPLHPVWICVKNISAGNSGVSHPSSVIAGSRQAMTTMIVTARSMRSTVVGPPRASTMPKPGEHPLASPRPRQGVPLSTRAQSRPPSRPRARRHKRRPRTTARVPGTRLPALGSFRHLV